MDNDADENSKPENARHSAGGDQVPKPELSPELIESLRSEHILLEGDLTDDAPKNLALQPQAPLQHFLIINRSHAIETELVIFEGGWLSVRQHRRSKPGVAQLINLKSVDREPEESDYFAKRSLYTTAALVVLGVCAGIMAYTSTLLSITVPAATLFLFGSGVSFAAFAYRTQKRYTFYTSNGRAPVISLLATIGSFKLTRRVVPEIVAAIDECAATDMPLVARLRDEMRDHYRMRESGIIDLATCNDATQRILRRFG